MPKELPITLIKGDKVSSKTEYRDFMPVNMTAVLKSVLGAAGYMLQFPGLTAYGAATNTTRGGVWNERFLNHYRVSGSDFIEVDENGNSTILGSVAGSGTVSLPYSFNTQGIIAGGNFYLYDPVNGFQQVTDPDLGTPIDGVWINGVYFFTDGDYVFHTDAADETMISPQQFATAEFMPDKSLGVAKTQDNKVIVLGRYSTEYFADRATDNFRFQRIEARALKIGIVGTHCKIELEDAFYIMGGRKDENISVFALGVGSAIKIATEEIEKIIAQYLEEELTTTVLETYKEDGYSYLLIHLPDETLLFNKTVAEKIGIEQAWTIINSGEMTYRAKHFVKDPRILTWVVSDKFNNVLGKYDKEVTTHYDELTEWVLSTPFINLEAQSIDELQIETMPGHTVYNDATVFISLTYNGVTYGTEWLQMYGLPAQYNTRFLARRLGYVSDWVGIKLRGKSRSRMAFGKGKVTYG